MEKHINEYIKVIDDLLEKDIKDIDKIINNHLIKISFFQHERLIHLIVTLTYGFTTVLSMILCVGFDNIIIFIVPILLLFLLIPYIMHYFKLENSVQYLYKQYEKMINKRTL